MTLLSRGTAIAVVLISAVFLVLDARSQSASTDGHSGLQPASYGLAPHPDVGTCSPAPCVLSPVWPSSSSFTADAPIAANPRNPKQLLLGSVDSDCPGVGPGFYLSSDGGFSWQQRCMPPFSYKGNEYSPIANPLVGYDSQGTAYEVGSYQINDDFSSDSFVAFQKSSDGGVTWNTPAPVVGHQDSVPVYSRLAVDASPTSPFTGSVYISAVLIGPFESQSKNQLVVSHSNDGGKNWSQIALTPVEPNNLRELRNPSLTVGRDGTVYVTWLLCDVLQSCGSDVHLLLSRSTDGGNTWSTPRSIAASNPIGWLPNTNYVEVADTPGIATDNSNGPHAGNIYIAMYSWTGSQMRVGVIRSTDGGNTWSKPVPVAPPTETHDQFFPWLSVSSTGLVGVSWMDRRNDPANVDYQAFAAISRDGGQSFGSNVQLTTGFSDPNRGGEGNGWIGDYTGNTWAGSNFVAAWMDNSNTPGMVDVVGGIRLK